MVIPGILETAQESAIRELKLLGSIAPKIQLDIADGLLVDGKTFLDLAFLVDLDINAEVQLHLMVQKPEELIATLPPTISDVCTHAESFIYRPQNIDGYFDLLKTKEIKIGLCFNLQTSFSDFTDWIKRCDYVQLMAINPGGQGRAFESTVLDKITEFKMSFPHIPLQVDGGMDQTTLELVAEAGADAVVIGSQIFKSPDPLQTYKDFMLQFENARRNFLNSRNTQN